MRSGPQIAVALTLLLGPPAAHAASVSGAFVERGGGQPLPGVEVVLRAASDSAVVAHTATDSAGRFRLDGLALGRYLLRASLLGYRSHTRDDVVLTDSAPDLELGAVPLAISPIALPGVETSTARSSVIVTSDRNIYLAKDLPGAGAGSTTDLLRSVPELEVDINDQVSLRGSSSVTIQINGRTSPLKGEALTAFLRQLPGSRIERIEVIANPSAKFDPEGMAGIVNIVTSEPLDLGWSGSVHTSLGDRNRGQGARAAWQQGRLTLHGGLSGYWGRYQYRYDDERHNLLAQPPSVYRFGSDTEYRSGFGVADASFDFAFDRRSTLYATASGYLSSGRSDALSGSVLSDGSQGVTSSYDRTSDGDSDWRSGTGTLGFSHVVEKSRNEWTLELRHNESPSRSSTDAIQHLLVPVDTLGQVSQQRGDDRTRERSLQLDDTFPLGRKGKLELGYRGAERRTASTNRLDFSSGSVPDALSDYVHRERFHSGYATVGSTFGRLSLQAGLRSEAANTTFEVIPRATSHDNDYRSVFPSANAAWDLGGGRTLRLTYSRRIERPSPWLLNPDVPTLDSLNRTEGNPFLGPKYTHSWSLDASWAGSRGLLRLSPFHRRTVDNWDQFKTVDSLGMAVTTWRNASSIRTVGTSLVASLRQAGRLGGTLNLSLYREMHDASNLSLSARRDATIWSLGGNVTFKANKVLDLQSFAHYRPAQTLAQGRTSGSLYLTLGARWKVTEKAWASLYLSDPFKLWKYEVVTSDASYTQTSTNRGSMRRASLAFGWSWGKPPETKQRKQAEEQPQQEQPAQPR